MNKQCFPENYAYKFTEIKIKMKYFQKSYNTAN